MRNATISLLIVLLVSAATRGAQINYDQIPANVASYGHVDIERLLSSRIWNEIPGGPASAAQINGVVGDHADATMFTIKGMESGILLVHMPDSKISKWLDSAPLASVGDFQITYNKQQIIYSSRGLEGIQFPLSDPGLFPAPPANGKKPTTQRADQKWDSPYSSRFVLGLGGGGPHADQFLYKGPCYAAIIAPGFVVATGDLPSMAAEIDVLQGIKPSLAKLDPQGIRMDLPAGLIMVGAGLTASFDKADSENTKIHTGGAVGEPAPIGKPGNGLGMNLFGSLQAKATLARFDFGEDENNLYFDGLFTMVDAESAEQLKNLATGVKALICLSQIQDKPLLDPIQLQTSGNNMSMRWAWSVDKLPDLIRFGQSINKAASQTTQPAD